MQAYSSLVHRCLFSFSSHLGCAFYLISRSVWFLPHLLQATPIPGQGGWQYTQTHTLSNALYVHKRMRCAFRGWSAIKERPCLNPEAGPGLPRHTAVHVIKKDW